MTYRYAPLLMLALTAFGCSSSESKGSPSKSSSPSPSANPSEDASDNLGKLSSPLRVTITVPGVAPGEENKKCLKVPPPNRGPVEMGSVHNTLSKATHHRRFGGN